MIPQPYHTINACWIIFLVYWLASARRVKPVQERENRSAGFGYRLPTILGALLIWVPVFRHPRDIEWASRDPVAPAVGAVVCVLGLLVAIWARRTLAGNWSSNVTFKQGHELIQTGPYRYVRHPIYTGMLMMLLGTALVGGRLHYWVGVLLVFIGFCLKLKMEESLMMLHFPDTYPAYRARVKALIPFVI